MFNVSLDFEYKSPIDKVWNALTNPDILAQWVMENNFKPIVGYKCRFWNKEIGLVVHSEVLTVNKPSQLSYTWIGGPIDTVVTWTLKQEGDITYVHLEQTGFPDQSTEYYGAYYGWSSMLEKLSTHLSGESI
ncbi:hypothetical protein BTS2_0426 [Bacillus sp. TS-2]|nr:hypothetical protein BTS2_0426 [Bacillus sp. TS-2]